MGVEYRRLEKSVIETAYAASIARVDHLADELRRSLDLVTADVDAAHIHGAKSAAIQVIVSNILRDRLGFEEEVVLTGQDGIVSRPRPDFIYRLGPDEGIIAEVERGGTVNNNHDLKDIWKAHIAPDVQHLFLIVPNSNWSADGRARERPFPRVTHRLGAFFGDPRREVDVVTCHIFGYGRLR